MNTTNLKLNYSAATGANLPVFLAEVRDDMEFIDNKPSGNRLGSRYVIACPANRFDKITVKILETQLLISQEELDALNAAGKPVMVLFESFSAKLYQDFKTKDLKMSATADKIYFADAKEVQK